MLQRTCDTLGKTWNTIKSLHITIQFLLTASQVIYVELTVCDNKILCLFMSELQSVSNVNILIIKKILQRCTENQSLNSFVIKMITEGTHSTMTLDLMTINSWRIGTFQVEDISVSCVSCCWWWWRWWSHDWGVAMEIKWFKN